jgi:hypothetical protein
MINHFFQLNWRRINARYRPETIVRHEAALMAALCRRNLWRMYRGVGTWPIADIEQL